MKEFATYTALRLMYFLVAYLIILGLWVWLTDTDGLIQPLPLILAFLVSGIAAFVLLDRQRDAFARRVEARASRASKAFEEARAREDAADDARTDDGRDDDGRDDPGAGGRGRS